MQFGDRNVAVMLDRQRINRFKDEADARHPEPTVDDCIGRPLDCGRGGCQETPKPYGTESRLRLVAPVRQVWAIAPAVNLSGQRDVDPLLQADCVYQQLQQIDGLTIVPVNRVVEVYAGLKIDGVKSPEQAAQVCELAQVRRVGRAHRDGV